MGIVALVTDLVFDSKVTTTASALGISVRTERRPDAALAACSGASGLIVDLNADLPERALGLIRQAKERDARLRIVAFLAHVQTELAAAARAAGADEVLPRSAFSARLAEILGRLDRALES